MRTTAQSAYRSIVKNQMKFQERGYGERIIFINDCPDCAGKGISCDTCGNEPNNPDRVIFVNNKWYQKLS